MQRWRGREENDISVILPSRLAKTHLINLLQDLPESLRQSVSFLGEQRVTRLSTLHPTFGDGKVHPRWAGRSAVTRPGVTEERGFRVLARSESMKRDGRLTRLLLWVLRLTSWLYSRCSE